MKSTFLSWNWRDFVKGLIVAVLTPMVPIVQQSITAGSLVFDWHIISLAAAGGFVGYMVKNFFTDDTKEAVKTLSTQNVTLIEHPDPNNPS